MVLGVADFSSCEDVSSFYAGLRIRLRVHAPQGSYPSMTNPYRQPVPPLLRDVCWSWGLSAFVCSLKLIAEGQALILAGHLKEKTWLGVRAMVWDQRCDRIGRPSRSYFRVK
jgi:hypothetical protein